MLFTFSLSKVQNCVPPLTLECLRDRKSLQVGGNATHIQVEVAVAIFRWGSPHVVGILMISLRGNKVGGRRWMRCGQNGRAGWSREFFRPLSSYSSLQLWRNYPQAQLGPFLLETMAISSKLCCKISWIILGRPSNTIWLIFL